MAADTKFVDKQKPTETLSKHVRISIIEMLAIAAMWLFLSQRSVTIPLFCIAVCVNCRAQSGWLPAICWTAVVISMFVPYDVRIADFSPQYRGAPRQHVRVVPHVVGMPMHTRLIARYGEYYSCGCVGVPIAPRGVVSIAIRVPSATTVPILPTPQNDGEQ